MWIKGTGALETSKDGQEKADRGFRKTGAILATGSQRLLDKEKLPGQETSAYSSRMEIGL